MLLKEVKSVFCQELEGIYPKEEIITFFSLLLEEILQLERFVLALHPQYQITKEEERPMFAALARLKNEEPIQHILGKAHFTDLELQVNPDVLIPRPETEELVQWVLANIPQNNSKPRILDIGTGSGCIAIALAKAVPHAEVVAVDISKKALQVAKGNAERNGVVVEFLQADILSSGFEWIYGGKVEHPFDYIVSNPPYVREKERGAMRKNVKAYEPQQALYVSDENPLRFYKAIVGFSEDYLSSRGQLFFEINQYLAQETRQLLVDNDFKEVELRKDNFGNIRFLKGIHP